MRKLLLLLVAACGVACAQDVDYHWLGWSFQDGDLTVGKTKYLPIPIGCLALHSWDLSLDQPGSARVDIWRAPYPNWPTSVNSITGGSPPTITSGHHAYSSNLSVWKRTVAAHDVIAFSLLSVTGGPSQVVTIVLSCQNTP